MMRLIALRKSQRLDTTMAKFNITHQCLARTDMGTALVVADHLVFNRAFVVKSYGHTSLRVLYSAKKRGFNSPQR